MKFPQTLQTIGKYAFAKNEDGLEWSVYTLEIPSGVTHIGDGAFSRLPLKTVTLPPLLTKICDHMFEDYSDLTSVNVPTKVTYIGASAFARTKISSIALPDCVTYIGASAFAQTKISSIDLPSSVTHIGDNAFINCQLTAMLWR